METLHNYLTTCFHNNSDFWSTWNVIQNFTQHHHVTNIEGSKTPNVFVRLLVGNWFVNYFVKEFAVCAK
jgi:hypothetical protein